EPPLARAAEAELAAAQEPALAAAPEEKLARAEQPQLARAPEQQLAGAHPGALARAHHHPLRAAGRVAAARRDALDAALDGHPAAVLPGAEHAPLGARADPADRHLPRSVRHVRPAALGANRDLAAVHHLDAPFGDIDRVAERARFPFAAQHGTDPFALRPL